MAPRDYHFTMDNSRELSDADWRQRLDDEQYRVLRQKGTEPPFTGKLLHNDATGEYQCAGCGNVLFKSDAKFESHCGWPSFYEAADRGAVTLQEDTSHGMKRVEVLCANCGGHLGHVFDDAPDQPTGQRYCINSASLNFAEKEATDERG